MTAGEEEGEVVSNMIRDRYVEYQVWQSNAETEVTTECIANTNFIVISWK